MSCKRSLVFFFLAEKVDSESYYVGLVCNEFTICLEFISFSKQYISQLSSRLSVNGKTTQGVYLLILFGFFGGATHTSANHNGFLKKRVKLHNC